MKKVLSLVLVIAMVLSSFSFAFAAPKFEDVTGDYEEAVNALVALGVIRGYEENDETFTFRPERNLSRAELAVLLVESLGYGGLVAGSNSNFSDTQTHWSNGYVAIATGTGLVLGYPDGTFKPDQGVSYDEAITMVLRAVGYVDSALKGTWPTNFKVKAIDLDLLDDVNMATVAADRGGVAQILFNALELDMMELGEENVLVKAGRLFIDNIAKPDTITVTKNTVNPDHRDYAGDVVDLEPYMFETLSVYLNDAKDVVYIKGSDSLILEGKVDKVEGSKVTVKDADDDKTTVTLETETNDDNELLAVDVLVYKNGAMATVADIEDLEDTETIKVVAFEDEDSNEDGEIDTDEIKGIVISQQTKVAKIAKEYVEGKAKIDTFVLPLDEDDEVDLANIVVTGDAEALDEIEVDDIVVEYKADDDSKTKLVVSREAIEGKVTRVTAATATAAAKYYIDGTAYTVNTVAPTFTIALGTEGTFFLDHNGKIAAIKGTTTEPTDYAVVVDLGVGKIDTDAFGKVSIKDYPLVKLATADNEVVTFEVHVKLNADKDALSEGNEYVALGTGNDAGKLIIKDTVLKNGYFVKYALDKKDRIEVISVIAGLSPFDTESSSFVLADDAVIFDNNSADDYPVINVSKLDKDGKAIIEYNNDGEIVAMLTSDVKAESDNNYAFVSKFDAARNADDDNVQLVTVYFKGEKVDYTTDDVYFDSVGVHALDFDGEIITGATTKSGIAGKVTSISTRTNSFVLKVGEVKTRYFLDEDATILEVVGTTYTLSDLYDIDGTDATVYTVDDVVFVTFK